MIPADLAKILRPADVLLVGRRGGVSDLIRLVTASRFSHVALVTQSMGAWIVLEATTDVKGVAGRQLEVITDDPTVEHLSLRRLSAGFDYKWDALGQDITQAFWLQTGEPYSNRVNFKLLLQRLGWVDPVLPTDGVNCAAATNEAYWKGMQLLLVDPAAPTPQAFAETGLLREIWSR
jgi:hypothetical protein